MTDTQRGASLIFDDVVRWGSGPVCMAVGMIDSAVLRLHSSVLASMVRGVSAREGERGGDEGDGLGRFLGRGLPLGV
jgi:hypothetical protein